MGKIFRTYFATMLVGSLYAGVYFTLNDGGNVLYKAWLLFVASLIFGLLSLITELNGFRLINKSKASLDQKHKNFLKEVFIISTLNLAIVFAFAFYNENALAYIGFAIAAIVFSCLWFRKNLFKA